MSELSEQVAALQERVGSISDKANAAHKRLDKTELLIREDFKEIKVELKEMNLQLVKITNIQWKTKGMWIAIFAIAGLLGTVFGNVVKLMLLS
jgi:hypothetical protein